MTSMADRFSSALRRWDVLVDGDELRGGMSVVVPVRSGDGSMFMLKLLEPADAIREVAALRAFPPSVCVRCFEHDDDLGALLLEQLTPESLAGRHLDEQITIQAQLAKQLAVPDPGGIESLTDPGWAVHLQELQRQCPVFLTGRAVGAALETIRALNQEPTASLTHGDLHSRNVHRDLTGRWRVLDPTPRVGTIAFESHTVIVERDKFDALTKSGHYELHRRLALFANVAAVDLASTERLCQARAANSALYEQLRGNAQLAGSLRWMAEALIATKQV